MLDLIVQVLLVSVELLDLSVLQIAVDIVVHL
jgi:hypothetical protein